MSWYNRFSTRTYIFIAVAIFVIAAGSELLMGRVPICKCGYVLLWHSAVFSSENSQHLFDWYTLTHILHGFGFYFLIWIVDRKKKLSFSARIILAVFLEAGWEVLENSAFIINRYRAVTISLDYFGDSVINSMGDIVAMALGFFLASRLRVSISVVFVIVIELFLAYFIGDNLTINLIMLIHPFDALRHWQHLWQLKQGVLPPAFFTP